MQCNKGSKERIKEMFNTKQLVELSVSAYDTAWVAMVPSLESPQLPCFPECVNWLLENQLPDGSWGLPRRHPLLIKDALSSTLACILALKRWNIGQEHIRKCLQFIGSNFASATDEKQHSPIGFDIIFSGMMEHAKDLGLNFPLSATSLDAMFQKRDLELKRGSSESKYCTDEGRKAYLAYVAEGLGNSQDWDALIKKYQKKNGSLFNSPSTTAAALLHHRHDDNCLKYLSSLLEKFDNAVPTTYPLDIYTHLCMVDSLERLGIDRHFQDEIKTVLDKIYRCWLQMDEEIFADTTTCAIAFRMLRMHGYEVSSGTSLIKTIFLDTLDGYLKDMGNILELYKASQIMIFPNESILEKQHFWSGNFLKEELLKVSSTCADGFNKHIIHEVDYTLNFPYYANLECLENRRNIEHFAIDNLRILKTSYRLNINNRDLLELAVEDFNLCQGIHQKELNQLERWVEKNKLDKLKFARQKLSYCYFSAAAPLFSPELSDARMSWTKNAMLATVIDDFFDTGGSNEELVNLIELVERWDGISSTDYCSEQVEIIFLALQNTTNEIRDKAFAWQGRDVTSNLTQMWLTVLRSMLREAEWARNNVSEEVIRDPEYETLYKLMSICGRLHNDIHGFKRERKEGKLNGVYLRMIHSDGVVTEEEAVKEMKDVIDTSRRELQRLVLKTKGSVVPRACKDLFWMMSKVVHLFYIRSDEFTSPQEVTNSVNSVIHEPLNLPWMIASEV
ncbi:Terpene synthase [Macleaya cordata]|uniref:Terpene synthase n=1 Tax=Macleaya cordata TaxID=56857 RepID=A0A200QJN1_MACCD|nr:Terpene synthase [Macleaya cordata]